MKGAVSVKVVIILALLVVIAAYAGWVTFSNTGDKAFITIDKDEARQDTNQAIEAGKDMLKKAEDKISGEDRSPTESPPPTP